MLGYSSARLRIHTISYNVDSLRARPFPQFFNLTVKTSSLNPAAPQGHVVRSSLLCRGRNLPPFQPHSEVAKSADELCFVVLSSSAPFKCARTSGVATS